MGVMEIFLKEIVEIKHIQHQKMESVPEKGKQGCKMYLEQENHLFRVINPL